MKKTIKRLSAILAILVLSMSIAVPVTAVEYGNETRAVRVLGHENMEYLDPDTDNVLLSGSASLYYNDVTKIASMSTSGSMGSYVYDFHDFGVGLVVYVSCHNQSNVRNPRAFDFGEDVHDIAEVYLTADVASDCISIGTGHALIWGATENDRVVAESGFFALEGQDFNY